MRKTLLTCCAAGAMLLASCAQVDSMPEPDFADIEAATLAAAELKTELRGELVAAIEANDVSAVEEICGIRADVAAQRISTASGYATSMVSVGGETDEWEAHVLQIFDEALASGVNPKFMEHSEVVLTADGDAEFRWMKPIFAGQALAVCHEADREEAARALLANGGEEATEFSKGDLRGAFSMRKSLEPVELAQLEMK